MAARPIWRGHLRLALVSCPVALHSVRRDAGNLRFHLINPETGNRVRMITQDAETGREVSRRDLVKGYEFERDRYVLLDEEDFDSARIDSSTTLVIDKFVDAAAIDPIWFDASYYLAPDGAAGADVYAVLREAIERSERVALSRVVLARRERAVAIRPMAQGLVLQTLHEPRDLYDAKNLFDELPTAKSDPEMVKLARQLIDRQTGRFVPGDTEDRYETRLREVIDAKLRGEGIAPAPEKEEDRGNVIDLMAALKKSLGQEGGDKPARRKSAVARKTSKRTHTTRRKAS